MEYKNRRRQSGWRRTTLIVSGSSKVCKNNKDVPKAAWGFRRRAEHVAHVPGDSEGVLKTLTDVSGGSEDVPNMSSCVEGVLECVPGFGKRAETSQNVRRDGEGVPMTSTKIHWDSVDVPKTSADDVVGPAWGFSRRGKTSSKMRWDSVDVPITSSKLHWDSEAVPKTS
ncbi:unnamed protein product [Heligmosomoides polygyrus]|uniref:CRIB domain-containing protein n=1 Tax=Heligmosomoides polygyrus TaxID=6339 RepID=A0A183FF07_HELPZ|nr:unnamed protein product [Heligmosomoides polygyrus]